MISPPFRETHGNGIYKKSQGTLYQKKVQGSGLAHGTYRPLIVCERGEAGSTGSEGSAGLVRRVIIEKRREVSIALRAHRHFERSQEIFIAERSSPDVRQHQDIVSPQRIHADFHSAVKISRLRSG